MLVPHLQWKRAFQGTTLISPSGSLHPRSATVSREGEISACTPLGEGGRMSWAHIHLALNHVPVIGLPIAVGLLAWAMIRRSAELTRASFVLLLVLAILTLVVQLTGEPAEDLVEGLPGVLDSMVERHEEAALIGTIGMGVLGLLALFGWWWSRAERRLARWYSAVMLVIGVL